MNSPSDKLRRCFVPTTGTLEALKWLAVLLMTVDHINLHLLKSAYPFMFAAGRLALPLFVFVLAFNLARCNGVATRVLWRLLPVAVIASLPYLELNLATVGFLPLNVLFTLASGTAVVALLERETRQHTLMAAIVFGSTGIVVEYGWIGLGLFVTIWAFFRRPTYFLGTAILFFAVLLVRFNMNYWAMAALPLIGVSFFMRIPMPRLNHALYFYYPLHLVLIVMLRILFFD